MQKLKGNKIVILIILLLVAGFYWYEWQPSQIRKMCAEQAAKWADIPIGEFKPDYSERAKEWNATYDPNYKLCLNRNGLEK